MERRKLKVLLIGESAQGCSNLAKSLELRGCESRFATTYQDACSLLTAEGFSLVLSPLRLRETSLFPLLGVLQGSPATLFYFQLVEEGCWWLPALRRGKKCFGSAAFRSIEFFSVLEETIEEIRSNMPVARAAQQY